MTSPGDATPSSWTEWVKLSSFFQVTVAPAATMIAAGSNLYDFGRSTVVVATGDAPVADPADEEQAPRTTVATTTASSVAARRAVAARRPVGTRVTATRARPA